MANNKTTKTQNIIQIDKNYLDIEIGGKMFKFDMTDKNIDGFQQELTKWQQIDKKHEMSMTKQSEFIINALSAILGKGSGEEIYKMCGESTIVAIKVFMQVTEIVLDNLNEEKMSKFNKYLGY